MEDIEIISRIEESAPPLTEANVLEEINEADLYTKLKKLQRHLEFLELQEEYIKDEQKNLKRELIRAQEEVKRIQSVPLVIGQFLEPIDQHTGIVGSTTGSNYVVRILSTIDRELLKPSSSVALHRHSNSLVDVLPPEADSSIAMLGTDEKPDVTYADVGGLDIQKQEIREAVELPLTHFDLYKQIGIDPPRGVLLYGPPGTGKTMLVKAVAHHTTASFIRVVGSEFVQKYLGEGPRMVRDVFRLARENSPAIIFIDEIDAIATKRFDAQTGADREVQRILLELLNQMDADTLDPALLRPGRLDRKIEFPTPDRRQKRLIFSTITAKMNLSEEVDLEDYVSRPDKLSGAEIHAICQEAGMQAVRKNRYVILSKDIEKGYKANCGWIILLSGAAAAEVQGGRWFYIVYQLFLIIGVLLTIITNSIRQYRTSLVAFIAIGFVFLAVAVDDFVIFSELTKFSSYQAAAAGGIFILMVEIVWIFLFGASEDSLVQTTMASFTIDNKPNPYQTNGQQSIPRQQENLSTVVVSPNAEYAYKAQALYEYQANPDDQNELSFSKGEILDIVDNKGKWWQARKADGSIGIAPITTRLKYHI
ncbi:19112_t:CDS:10 [Entrophospora sp. SA101]|nr:22821_t:CDS:10 [Entrophospora sp. SA101]CAJ0752471.1 19112_t:CDS:10 [Entrophospora sp. SA101]